jgi:hypothetical protein
MHRGSFLTFSGKGTAFTGGFAFTEPSSSESGLSCFIRFEGLSLSNFSTSALRFAVHGIVSKFSAMYLPDFASYLQLRLFWGPVVRSLGKIRSARPHSGLV